MWSVRVLNWGLTRPWFVVLASSELQVEEETLDLEVVAIRAVQMVRK